MSTPSDDTKPAARLVAAAEELLQASGVEIASERQKKVSSDLVSFKESVDAKLNTVVQIINSSNTNFDAKINTTNQHVADLKAEVTCLKAELAKQTRMQNLAFAVENTKLESFDYYQGPNSYYGERKNSSALVSLILLCFRKGLGYYLPAGAMQNNISESSKEAWEKSNKEFHTKLQEQVFALVGTKPRIQLGPDGKRFVIYEK